MNRTKIEWCDRTWNPVTGCLNDCWYCYARKIFRRFNKSFEPEFHPERLKDPELNGKSLRIFVCSVADLFAEWTKPEWRDAVLNTMKQNPQPTYHLLTKFPENIPEGSNYGSNVWVGTTITNGHETENMYNLVNRYAGNKFISFEPLLGHVPISQTDGYFDKIGWVIIGKLTGRKALFVEKYWQREWVSCLIGQASARDIPIFIKNNVGWFEKTQEFPV